MTPESTSISIPLNSEFSSDNLNDISSNMPVLQVKNGKVIIPNNLKLEHDDKLQISLIDIDTNQPYDGIFFIKNVINEPQKYNVWDDARKLNLEYEVEIAIENKISKYFEIIAVSTILIIIISYFVLAFASEFVADRNDSDICFYSSKITFNYITWLKIFYIMTLTITGLILLLTVLDFAIRTASIQDQKTILEKIAGMFSTLGIIFQISWYIIGSILYFQTIYPNCQGTMIYNFGFALFVIQTISFVCFWIIGCVSSVIYK